MSKKNLIKYMKSFMRQDKLSNGAYIDFERPLILNGKLSDYSVTRSGEVISYKFYNTDKPKVIAHSKLDNGYHIVNLLINGKEKTYRVHRLVAETFIPNPDSDLYVEVNHKNGNKDDNSEDNLEWVTCSENIKHAYATGLASGRKGEKHHNATITESDAHKICQLLAHDGLSMKEVSKKLGISYSIIKKIKNGQRWTHVSKDYDFSNYISEKKR